MLVLWLSDESSVATLRFPILDPLRATHGHGIHPRHWRQQLAEALVHRLLPLLLLVLVLLVVLLLLLLLLLVLVLLVLVLLLLLVLNEGLPRLVQRWLLVRSPKGLLRPRIVVVVVVVVAAVRVVQCRAHIVAAALVGLARRWPSPSFVLLQLRRLSRMDCRTASSSSTTRSLSSRPPVEEGAVSGAATPAAAALFPPILFLFLLLPFLFLLLLRRRRRRRLRFFGKCPQQRYRGRRPPLPARRRPTQQQGCGSPAPKIGLLLGLKAGVSLVGSAARCAARCWCWCWCWCWCRCWPRRGRHDRYCSSLLLPGEIPPCVALRSAVEVEELISRVEAPIRGVHTKGRSAPHWRRLRGMGRHAQRVGEGVALLNVGHFLPRLHGVNKSHLLPHQRVKSFHSSSTRQEFPRKKSSHFLNLIMKILFKILLWSSRFEDDFLAKSSKCQGYALSLLSIITSSFFAQ